MTELQKKWLSVYDSFLRGAPQQDWYWIKAARREADRVLESLLKLEEKAP